MCCSHAGADHQLLQYNMHLAVSCTSQRVATERMQSKCGAHPHQLEDRTANVRTLYWQYGPVARADLQWARLANPALARDIAETWLGHSCPSQPALANPSRLARP